MSESKDMSLSDPQHLITDMWDLEDLARRLKESESQIEVPLERLERVRVSLIEAIDADFPQKSRRYRRLAALLAATLGVVALGATAYASSNADPGSPLWELRTVGWNLELAFTKESHQDEVLVEQAGKAAELADKAASRCDSKGVEVARKEAIERIGRAREKIGQRSGGDSAALEVLARVENKLAELPPPGGPVCDANSKRLPGPGRGAGLGLDTEDKAPGKSDQAPGHSKDRASAEEMETLSSQGSGAGASPSDSPKDPPDVSQPSKGKSSGPPAVSNKGRKSRSEGPPEGKGPPSG